MTDQPDTTEPTPACPVCAKPNDDRTWRICDRDRDAVLDWLDEIEQLHCLIRTAPLDYLMPATSGSDAPLGGHREPPPPLDMHALDLLTAESLLRGMDADDMGLEDWAVDWRHWNSHASHGQATEHDRSPADTLAGVIRYLKAQWPAMALSVAAGGHPAADEFHGDVRKARSHAWAALGSSPPTSTRTSSPRPTTPSNAPPTTAATASP
jgi:hypothetical protein